jgi:hypothetical protein
MTAPEPSASGLSYPPAPWHMVGQQWLSLFRVREDVDPRRPAGIYGAAFVRYEEGSPLTYSELLVGRAVESDGHGRRVTITDIWVDSPASVAGGRELWAIPKELCDFSFETSQSGPLASTGWSATVGRQPIVSARFRDVSRAGVRLPFKGATWQPGIDDTDGHDRTATLQGSAKSLPCRGSWDFDRNGPLGWLRDARRLASFRMAGFRMSFT